LVVVVLAVLLDKTQGVTALILFLALLLLMEVVAVHGGFRQPLTVETVALVVEREAREELGQAGQEILRLPVHHKATTAAGLQVVLMVAVVAAVLQRLVVTVLLVVMMAVTEEPELHPRLQGRL
jgi:hypothetical protein